MQEFSIEPESGQVKAEQAAPQSRMALVSDDYWRSFRLFPFPFEHALFKYGVIIEMVLFLGLLGVGSLLDANLGLPFWGANSYTRTVLNWIPFLWNIGLIALLALFNWWKEGIPATFQALLSKSHGGWIAQEKAGRQDYGLFLEKYQQSLLSRKRYLFSGFLLLIGCGVTLGAVLTNSYLGHPLFFRLDRLGSWWIGVWITIAFILPIILWSYIAGAGVWLFWITGWSINRLISSEEFVVRIQPAHPDHCGGLKPLGHFFLTMVAPLLLGAAVLEVFDIGLLATNASMLTAFIAGANIALLALDVPLAYITLVPLLNIHKQMVARQKEEENEFADRMEKLENSLRTSLDKGALEEAKSLKDEIEITQLLDPDKKKYPLWPFSLQRLITFWVAVILPFISFISLVIGTLQSGLSLFFGTH